MADLKVGIPLTILLVLAGVITTAKLLHHFMPKPEIIVSPFELPFGTDHIPWTGKTVANLFIDELQQVIRSANEFHGNEFSSKRQYHTVPDLPKIPIEKSFELQFQGVSLKQVMSAWDYLRYDQQLFSGDIILNQDDMLVLRARVAADKQAMYWEVSELEPGSKIPKTAEGLKKGLQKLAIQVFTSLNPETIGRCFLATGMGSRYQNQQHQFGEAQKVFEQWSRREPTRPEPFFYLSYTYNRLQQFEDSKYAAEQAFANDDSYYLALGMIASALDSQAFNAREADRAQKMEDAVNKHHAAIRASSKWWQFWAKDPPDYANNLCIEYTELEQYSKAESACEKAKRSDPNYANALNSLGWVYQARARDKEASDPKAAKQYLIAAERNYRAALKKQPDFFLALSNLRIILMNPLWKRYAEAEKECERAVAVFPWAAEPLVELGRVYEADQSRKWQAMDSYRRATRTDPTSPVGWNALAEAEFSDRDYQGALEHFQRAFDLEGSPETQAKLGRALIVKGESILGLKHLEAALKLRPNLADEEWFQLAHGDAYLAIQHFREAYGSYTSAEHINVQEHQSDNGIKLLRDMPVYQRYLGDVLFGLHEFGRAAECYSKAEVEYSADINFKLRFNEARKRMEPTNSVGCTTQAIK
jgi:tetratricopeptide (TPR) repeat protein